MRLAGEEGEEERGSQESATESVGEAGSASAVPPAPAELPEPVDEAGSASAVPPDPAELPEPVDEAGSASAAPTALEPGVLEATVEAPRAHTVVVVCWRGC